MRTSTLVLFLCMLVCADARTLVKKAEVSNNVHCNLFGQQLKLCVVVEDITRLILDIPRTVEIIEDVPRLIMKVMEILHKTFRSPAEIVEALIAVPLDMIFRLPNIIASAIKNVIPFISWMVDDTEKWTKNPSLKDVEEFIGISGIITWFTFTEIMDGIAAGMEKSGMGYLAEHIQSFFSSIQHKLKPLTVFLIHIADKIFSLKCNDIMPDKLCDSVFWVYRKIVDLFWNIMHGPVKVIKDRVLEFIFSILDVPRFEEVCKKVLPSKFCVRIEEIVKGVDLAGEEVIHWIKVHIFQDLEYLDEARISNAVKGIEKISKE